MVQALAPRRPLGYRRGFFALLVGGCLPLAILAQAPGQTPAKDDPKPPVKGEEKGEAIEDPKGDPAAPDAPIAGLVDASKIKKIKPLEVFKDPRALKYLANTFPELKRPANYKSDGPMNETLAIKPMAGGVAPYDQAAVQRYVDYCVSELTNHANIKSFLEVPVTASKDAKKNAEQARLIGRAADLLLEPLITAKEAKNASFLTSYNKILLATLPKLLDNHLIARNQAMIVLGLSGNQDAVDLYVKQLSDPNQVVWVKEWAARGLTIATQSGKQDLRDIQKTLNAAKALSDFLDKEEDSPYVVKARVLEALGSLRQASTQVSSKAEMSTAAMKLLSNREAHPLVRAWAAWALGMIKVGPQVPKYNYGLVAYSAGLAAADIGEMIVKTHEESDHEATQLASYLLFQILPAFEGDVEVRESGFMKMPGAKGDQKLISELLTKIQALSTSAVKLVQATPTVAKPRREDVAAKVADLRAFLDKNKPKDLALVPGGPQFGDAPRVAGNGDQAK